MKMDDDADKHAGDDQMMTIMLIMNTTKDEDDGR